MLPPPMLDTPLRLGARERDRVGLAARARPTSSAAAAGNLAIGFGNVLWVLSTVFLPASSPSSAPSPQVSPGLTQLLPHSH